MVLDTATTANVTMELADATDIGAFAFFYLVLDQTAFHATNGIFLDTVSFTVTDSLTGTYSLRLANPSNLFAGLYHMTFVGSEIISFKFDPNYMELCGAYALLSFHTISFKVDKCPNTLPYWSLETQTCSSVCPWGFSAGGHSLLCIKNAYCGACSLGCTACVGSSSTECIACNRWLGYILTSDHSCVCASGMYQKV